MHDPYQVVREFEAALCEYSGAPYCVTTTSCTMALLLAVAWQLRHGPQIAQWEVSLPRFTYIGVPMSIVHAGGLPTFRDEKWEGEYRLKPLPVWDCARWFRADMYETGMCCLSFHHTKHLGISTHGGAILHDDPAADAWLRRARFDGRAEGVTPKDDRFEVLGWHANMQPPTAAEGLMRLRQLPKYNEPLPWGPGTDSDYPDLSEMEIFLGRRR